MSKGVLNTDGASRGNPGPAGMGFTLQIDDGRNIHGGCFIGEVSNNVAEYSALIWGLDNARAAGVKHIEVLADSELMVKQLNGEYKVKNMGLKPLFVQAKGMLSTFETVSVKHVYRSGNSLADGLANEGIDKQAKVGNFLRQPSISQSLFEMPSADMATRHEIILESSTMAAANGSVAESDIESRDLFSESIDEFDYESKDVALDTLELEPLQAQVRHMYELTVKEHFDAAHALVGYAGKCRNLHGHTWDVEVSVEGSQLDDVGILYDFKALKEDLKDVLDAFDHRFLNETEIFRDMNSTAENMARVIYEQMEERLPAHVRLCEVCVWESPVARLRYRKMF